MKEAADSFSLNVKGFLISSKIHLQGWWLIIGLILALIVEISLYILWSEEWPVMLSIPMLIIVISIIIIRNTNAAEIYWLWFLFFNLFYLSICIYIFFDAQHLLEWHSFESIPSIEKSNENNTVAQFLIWYFEVSTNFWEEIFLISIVSGLFIIPQILSFFISGLFGCGKLPVLISKIINFSILSFIKFNCGFAAFAMSSELYRIYINGARYTSLYFEALIFPFSILALTFALAAFYFRSEDLFRLIAAKKSAGILTKIRNHMTRYTDRQMVETNRNH